MPKSMPSTEPAADAVWLRLQRYFDDWPELRERLRSALGWSHAEAGLAVREYQRFCWLCTQSTSVLSPSESVDQVWHQHLQYTRDYWGRFCPLVLGRSLHHEPGSSGREAVQRHRRQYAETLALYQQHFGPPPVRFWPSPAQQPQYRIRPLRPRASIRHRFRLGWTALIALATPATAAAAQWAWGPLDWAGPQFLLLFMSLMPLSVLISQLLRRAVSNRGAVGMRLPTPLELAWLAGGAERYMDAAVTALMSGGWVRWDAQAGSLQSTGNDSSATPELRRVLNALRLEPRPARLRRQLRAVLRPVQEELIRQGWSPDPAAASRAQWGAALLPTMLLALGVAKIGIGIERDRPVAFLVVLCSVLALYVVGMLLSKPRCTREGRAVLQRARRQHVAEQRAPRTTDLPLAVALLGTAALSGSAFADYHQGRVPGDSGGSGCSGSTGGGGDGGGGGSGCGGCGGGGD